MLDRGRIWRRYLRSSSFAWDVASLLPIELLCLRRRSAMRANRCLRAPRLFEAFDRRETRTAHPSAFRIAKLMLYVFIAIHWNACLYFALSVRLGLGSDTWVHPNGSRPGFARPLRQYLHSFYISTLILTTVGDTPEPRREEELLFMTAGFLLAVLAFATIMGSMSSVIANMSAADASFYPDHGPVQRYLRAHGVAGRLVRRVAAWHEHLRVQRKLAEEHVVLRHLPERLRAEVAASVHLPALSKVALFQSCERGVLEALVLRLRPQVFGPGEFVCRRGDVGREMYFIREGRLEVLGADGVTQLAVLGEGLYFGEISLINIPGEPLPDPQVAIPIVPPLWCHPRGAIPRVPSPQCHPLNAVPSVPSPHDAIPTMPSPECHPHSAIPTVPSPQYSPLSAIPMMPSPQCHPHSAILMMPSPQYHPLSTIPTMPSKRCCSCQLPSPCPASAGRA